jgi:hypothetical protein
MLRAKGALGFLNTLWAKPKSIASGRSKADVPIFSSGQEKGNIITDLCFPHKKQNQL